MSGRSRYWERRRAQDAARAYADAEKLTREIGQLHAGIFREIRERVERIRTRFGAAYSLTGEERDKLLREPVSRKEHLELIAEIGRLGPKNPKRDELLAKAASPAYAYRLSRAEAMEAELDAMTARLAQEEEQLLEKHLIAAAQDQSLRAGFRIQQRAGVGFAFGGVSEELARVMIRRPWSGSDFSARIWQNQDALQGVLNTILREGLTAGRSGEKIAKDIAGRMGVSMSRARTLVRTETSYVCNEADFEAYDEAEIERYRFDATLDMRTSKICQEQDGKVYLKSEAQVGVNRPPMHPNCRSGTVPVYSEEDLARMKRWSRDPVTGKDVYVSADMTYEEWLQMQKDTYSEERVDAARKMAANKKQDKAQYEKYKAILGRKHLPKNLETFQQMKYTEPEEWEETKSLYRDVNWQKKAQENHHAKGEEHKMPNTGTPNSVFDNYANGVLIQRRYYGRTGKPRLDLDLIDHGTPNLHLIVPHAHSWTENVSEYPRREKGGRALSKAEQIANKDILGKKVKKDGRQQQLTEGV